MSRDPYMSIGEYEEMYALCNEPEQELCWTTREGQRIPISQLEDSHLLNILRFLKRRAKSMLWRYQLEYLSWPAPQGDMAELAWEQSIGELADMTPMDYLLQQPIFVALCEEAMERGLIKTEPLDE